MEETQQNQGHQHSGDHFRRLSNALPRFADHHQTLEDFHLGTAWGVQKQTEAPIGTLKQARQANTDSPCNTTKQPNTNLTAKPTGSSPSTVQPILDRTTYV